MALCTTGRYDKYVARCLGSESRRARDSRRNAVRLAWSGATHAGISVREGRRRTERVARGAKGVCCRPCQQIATKSSTNHQQQRRPRAPPRASSRVVASSRSSSREPLLVFVSLRVRLSISLHQVSRRSLLSLEVTIPRTSTSCSFSQSPKPPFVLVLIHCA